MSALETHLGKMQNDAATLEAIARAMRALSDRDDKDARALLINLADMAFSLSRILNNGLDAATLPEGGAV